MALIANQEPRKLGQGELVYLALEFDYRFKRHPVFVPTPGIEFGLVEAPQAHIAVPADQPQQEPDLLLAAIVASPVAAQPLRRHPVAQPFARAPEDSDT